MISSSRRLPPRILANFKIQKRLFSLNAYCMKEKNDVITVKKPTNSSDDPAETQGLVTSIHSENLIMMPLPAIKQIYDEHKAETKKLYDEHIQRLEAKNDEHIQKLEAKNDERKAET